MADIKSNNKRSVFFKGEYNYLKDIAFMGVLGLLIAGYFTTINLAEGKPLENEINNLAKNLLFSIGVSVLLYGLFNFMFRFLNKYHPWTKSIKGRLVVQIPLVIFISGLGMTVYMIFWEYVIIKSSYKFSDYLSNILVAIFISFLVNTIYEAVNLFRQLKNKELEAEMLKRKNIESHFETLKNQVGPHFLFNSLNTLLSLMDEDIDSAKVFVEKLAAYYRYALQVNDQDLVELSKEVKLLESYIYLLSSRFGDNLEVEIEEAILNSEAMIVPLSIQMLFENAVKHNVISRHKKLKIYIGINDNCIFVENNLQVKDSLMSSNGIGLENIQSRYKLSANKDIKIIKTDYLFRVELPLIAL